MSEHIHKLRRHKYKNGTEIYFCSLNCDYRLDIGLAVGKKVLCNICSEPFVMNEYSARQAKPHCSGCGKQRVKNPDGTVRFVNKSRVHLIASDLADNSIGDLRSRLSTVVTMEKDEDI